MESHPINDIFATALEIESERSRQKYLDEVCAENVALRAKVEQLLSDHQKESASGSDNSENFRTVEYSKPIGTAGSVVGPYKLLQQIGEGGMGSVWMAEQEHPVRRMVALKIIKAGMDSKQVIARFEAERQALALMSHPNIAQVLDAGTTESGRPYFVMELVKGVPITKFCDKNKFSPQQRLKLFIDVCRAIQHAHQKAIIHRDIKPSNVMVTLHDGVPVVKVIDFGLAKATSQKLTERTLFTAYGQMVGTPTYMSPEQAEMSGLDVDTRTDVYSLGVLLYELMTGTTPLDSKSLRKAGFSEIQRMIQEEEAPRMSLRLSSLGGSSSVIADNRGSDPGRLLQFFRGDLEVIAAKALEKDRSRRYTTANDLADDVQRFLDNEAIEARPASSIYRLKKTYQRNRAALLTVASVACILILATIFSSLQAIRASVAARDLRIEQEKTFAAFEKAEAAEAEQRKLRKQAEGAQAREEQQRQQIERNFALAEEARAAAEKERAAALAAQEAAEAAEERGRRLLYATDMRLAPLLWKDSDATLAQLQSRLDAHNPATNPDLEGKEDLRGFEWYYYQHLLENGDTTFGDHQSTVAGGALTSDGQLVTITDQGQLRRWDLLSRLELESGRQDLANGLENPQSGVLSNDGRLAALAAGTHVHIFNTLTSEEIWQLDSRDYYRRLIFSPDSKQLVVVDDQIRWLNADDGELIASLEKKFDRGTGHLAVSADGSTLAVAGHGPNGGQFSVFQRDGTSDQIKPLAQDIDYGGSIDAIALSPDGRLVATGAKLSGHFTVWNTTHGKSVAKHLSAHSSPISAMAFSADGTQLATAGIEGTLKIWSDVEELNSTSDPSVTLKGHAAPISSLTFSSDQTQLLSTSADRSARLWNVNNPGVMIDTLTGSYGSESQFSPDASLTASLQGKYIQLWDTATGQRVRLLSHEDSEASANCLAFSPTDHDLLAVGYSGPEDVSFVSLWDLGEAVEVARFSGASDLADFTMTAETGVVGTLAFSPDGKYLAAGFGSQTVYSNFARNFPLKVWDVDDQRLVRSLKGHTGHCVSLDFSPDGALLASGSHDGRAILWSTETWNETSTILNPDQPEIYNQDDRCMVDDVAFSPDGTTLAMASLGRNVHLWDIVSGDLIASLTGHSDAVHAVAFSPDGRTLASGSSNGTVRLWDLRTRRQLLPMDAGNIRLGRVDSLEFSPDAKQLLAGGAVTAVWSATPKLSQKTDRIVRQLEDRLASENDFREAIRMASEDLQLHVALEKIETNDARVDAALAATRSHWNASQQRWIAAADQFAHLCQISGEPPEEWLRPTPLLRVAHALLEARQASRAGELVAAAAEQLRVDGITRTNLLGIRFELDTASVTITSVVDRSPTARAGLQAEDRILKVNDTVLTEKNIERFTDLLKGEPGTKLRLSLRRADREEVEQVTVTKEWWYFDTSFEKQLDKLRTRVNERLAAQPDDLAAVRVRAEVRALRGDTTGQIADYTSLIDALSENESGERSQEAKSLYTRRGDVYLAQEKWQRAVDDYDQAISHGADNDQLQTNRALALANVILEGTDSAAPEIVDPWTRLAAAHRLQGDSEAVNRLVEEHPEIASSVGDLFAENDQWQRAGEIYSLGVIAGNTETGLLIKRARAFEKQQAWRAAANAWDRVPLQTAREAGLLADFANRLALFERASPLAAAQHRRARNELKKRVRTDSQDIEAIESLIEILLEGSVEAPWAHLLPMKAETEGSLPIREHLDGTLVIEESVTRSDKIVLQPIPDRTKALRIETAEESEADNTSQPNFNSYRIELLDAPRSPAGSLRGRYVRIDLPGENFEHPRHIADLHKKMLNLSELQVFRGEENVALGKRASQSSTHSTGKADLGVDGDTDSEEGFRLAHTESTKDGNNPWWEVDLGKMQNIDRIVVWNRRTWIDRMNHFRVRILDQDRNLIFEEVVDNAPNPSHEIDCRSVLLVEKLKNADRRRTSLQLGPEPVFEQNKPFRISATAELPSLEEEQEASQVRKIPSHLGRLAAAFAVADSSKEAVDYFARALAPPSTHLEHEPVLEYLTNLDEELQALADQLPNDFDVQLILGRQKFARGQTALSDDDPELALVHLKQADDLFSMILDPTPQWETVKPIEISSENGSRLELLEDSSIFVRDPADKDSFKIVFQTDSRPIRGVRLEALPDERLPRGGPGLITERPGRLAGTFVLTGLSLSSSPHDRPEARKPIELRGAWAEFSQSGFPVVELLDESSRRGWAIAPQVGRKHIAFFETSDTVSDELSRRLTVQLDHQFVFEKALLGRFRLSFTTDPDTLQATRVRLDVAKDELADLYASLGIAFARNKMQEEAIATLSRALTFRPARDATLQSISAAKVEPGILQELADAHPKDMELQILLGRRRMQLGQRLLGSGRTAEALTELQHAEEIFQQLRSLSEKWIVVTPVELSSEKGSNFELRNDNTIYVSEPEDNDSFTIEFESDLEQIRGLRLEALADSELPGGGPGTGGPDNGSFFLTRILLDMAPLDQPDNQSSLSFADAWADFTQAEYNIRDVIDKTARGNWAIWPRMGQSHTAFFEVAGTKKIQGGKRLTVQLQHRNPVKSQVLGRFRLSVADNLETVRVSGRELMPNDSELAQLSTQLGTALAEREMIEDAAAAFNRALDLSPNIDRKVLVVAAVSAFPEVMRQIEDRRDDQIEFHIAVGKHHAYQGRAESAKVASAKARDLLKQELAENPQDAKRAGQLANLLLAPDPDEWTVLRPTELESAGGATLTLQPDSSILGSGTNPDQDTYTLTCQGGPERITAIRLEALPHSSLPRNGPGRSERSGNFHLNELSVSSQGDRISLNDIYVTFAETRFNYREIIDGRIDSSCWSVYPSSNKKQSALIQTDFERDAQDQLKASLIFSQSSYDRCGIGRFRLSVSDAPSAFERARQRLEARKLEDPWRRLAAAYRFVGDQQALDKLKEQHPEAVSEEP